MRCAIATITRYQRNHMRSLKSRRVGPGVRSRKTSSLSPVRPPSPRVALPLASRGAASCHPRATATPHSGQLALDAPNPQDPTSSAFSPVPGKVGGCDSHFHQCHGSSMVFQHRQKGGLSSLSLLHRSPPPYRGLAIYIPLLIPSTSFR